MDANADLTCKAEPPRHRLPLPQAALMISQYARRAIGEQGQAIAFLLVYLVVALALVFRAPVPQPLATSLGILAVVVGLAFFIEGLLLGVMPLGETCGRNLASRTNLVVTLLFALLLGTGATYAEPSIVALRAFGAQVRPWDAPLLFLLLNTKTELLMLAVGIGVGLAVVLSALRFIYGWSLKPLLFVVVPVAAAITLTCAFDPLAAVVVGLAWDCGGVTTGPVTVPLVVALGMGLTRNGRGEESGMSGLGIVSLASLLPVITVLGLALGLRSEAPAPMTREAFFAAESRTAIARLFAGERELKAYLVANLEPERVVEELGGPEAAGAFLAELAAEKEAAGGGWLGALRSHAGVAARAVLPLSGFLLLVIYLVLRVRPRHLDEMMLGVLFTLAGMALFSYGVGTGLARLGEEAGRNVPSSFMRISFPERATAIERFDPASVNSAVGPDGRTTRFFFYEQDGSIAAVEYDAGQYDPGSGRYVHVPRQGPLVGPNRLAAGIALALLIVFLMGYGATLAEPALATLGIKVEEISVGTFRRVFLVRAVAVGVGIGLGLGFARIVWNVPLYLLILPPYALALLLTLKTSEEYACIAWDSGGVTTGPITVPLVISLGLGIGSQTGAVESFGICGMASICPILTSLLAVNWLERRRRARMREG